MRKTELLGTTKRPFASFQLLAIVAIAVVAGVYAVTRIFAASATMTLVPSATSVNIGDMVTVQLRENSGVEAINTVQGNVTYDSTKLQFVGFNETGSAFATVVTITQTAGVVQAARGTNGTQTLSGDQLVTTLSFKALTAGSVPLALGAGSAIVRVSDFTDILAVKTGTTLTLADLSAPTVPAGLASTTTGITNVNLSWTASTDNVAVSGYRVFRNNTQVGTTSGGVTSYSDTGLTAATAYTYKVAGFDAAGNASAQSTGIVVTTAPDTVAPGAPGKPTSSTQTMTSVTLDWTAATDNIAVTGYRVFRNGVQVGAPTTVTYTDTGLAINTTFNYTVAAVDAAGNVSAQTAITAVKTLADTSAPTVPTALKGTIAGTTVALTWTASTDNVAVAGYSVYQDNVLIAPSVATANYNVTNVTPGSHTYVILAFDAAGNKSALTAGVVAAVFVAGDVTKDGRVDVFDLSGLLSNWGKTGVNANDLNNNGTVDLFDLSILLSHWTG